MILRGIPELLVSHYPVGYETITYYAPTMMSFYGHNLIDVFAGTFKSGPIFYVLMWLALKVSNADTFLILKVTGPLLYGCLAVSFLFFMKRGLKLNKKMAIVATLLLLFQVATLRESWDRFRNVLGLIFVFPTLTALKSESKFKWPLVTGFALLTALSREYIAIFLFATVLGFVFLEGKNRVESLAALTPALAVFAIMFFPRQSWFSHVPGNEYFWTITDVTSIFLVCFLPILPFVVKGFRRDKLFNPMLGLLLLGSFSVIASPWLGIPYYQRWIVLLVFPFIVYTLWGLERLQLFNKGSSRKLMAVLLIFLVSGVGYSSGAFSYIALPNSWIPTNMVQSSIGWHQIKDVKGVLMWLDENAVQNSSILTEEKFFGWTLLYLERANDDINAIVYSANSQPTMALEKALRDDFSCIYLIWHTNLALDNFQKIYSQNGISIFQYNL